MFTLLFRPLRWQLAGILLAFSFAAQAQGVKGFSSQTQPSEVVTMERISVNEFDQRIKDNSKPERVAKLKLIEPKLKYEEAQNDSTAKAIRKGLGVESETQQEPLLLGTPVLTTQVAKANYKIALQQRPTLSTEIAPEALSISKTESVTTSPVSSTEIAIDDSETLLRLYDRSYVQTESQKRLGKWHVGIVSDGDFNKTLAENEDNVSTPKTGSLGIDAVFMKPVYYEYTYTGLGLTPLTGAKMVRRPYIVLNTLAIIFAQTTPLSTGLSTTQPVPERRAFGQALLVPGSNAQSGLSFTVNGSWFPWLLTSSHLQNITIDLNLNLTQTRWESQGVTSDVNIFAPMLGGSYRILDENIKVGTTHNYVQVLVFGRYSGRHLFGDIQRQTGILEDALGTRNRTYHGFDVGFTTSINAIRLTINVPVMEGDIEGFSDGQPVLGLGLAAAIRLN
jgi:hypothetical protein